MRQLQGFAPETSITRVGLIVKRHRLEGASQIFGGGGIPMPPKPDLGDALFVAFVVFVSFVFQCSANPPTDRSSIDRLRENGVLNPGKEYVILM